MRVWASTIVSGALLLGGQGCTRAEPAAAADPGPARSSGVARRPPAAGSAFARARRSPPPAAPASDAGPAVAQEPTRYPFDRTHSPLTAGVIAHLSRVRARDPSLRDDRFAKVGDSVTESVHALTCFGRPGRDLGAFDELAETIERFGGADGSPSSFRRESLVAKIGWSAWQALAGIPPFLQREVDAIRPRYALLQYGTNDIQIGSLHHFADSMLANVDALLERGVIPILFTIMPRTDTPEARAAVPRYNAVIHGIAQARQVPLVDYHRELLQLPGFGLAADGIHPSAFRDERGYDACNLSPAGLRHGFNVRNLLALQALARVTGALTSGRALDEEPERLEGSGTEADPFVVRKLPFVDFRQVTAGGARSQYAGCPGAAPATAAESWYRLELETPSTLRANQFDWGSAQLDLRLLRGERCVEHAARGLLATLGPGPHRINVDGAVAADDASFLITLLAR